MTLPEVIQQFRPLFVLLQASKKTAFILSLLLVFALAWLVGQFVSRSLEVVYQPSLQQGETSYNNAEARGRASYIFGKPDKKLLKSVSKSIVDDVIDTRLNMTLVGVIDIGDNSVALIEKSGKTLVVLEGDEIIPQVLLLDVFPDAIIIENRGVQERLALKASKNSFLTKDNRKVKNKNVFNKANSLSSVSSSSLNKIGRELKKSPMSIAKFIKFKPVNKNGSWAGVQIWSKSDKKLFREVGFEEGDMLIDVNGRSVSELAKNPAMWREFLKESQFQLIVERNGQEHNVAVDFSGS